jgi:two-component system nitrate/nitrite response regulator NarL
VHDVSAAARVQHAHPGRLLLVSGQALLAETLGARLADVDGWAVDVVDAHRPDLLDVCRRTAPDLIVFDAGDRGNRQTGVLARLVDAVPAAAVLVLGDLDADAVADAIELGARGCLTYDASIDEVRDAVRRAATGDEVVPVPGIAALIERLQRANGESTPGESLSRRERDILRRLAAGDNAARIAADLDISVQTVRKHIQNMLGKLGVHSQLEAAAYAVRHGIV